MKSEVSASVELKDSASWSKKGRKDVADWLRHCAEQLEKFGEQYDKRFLARYYTQRS